MAGWNASAAGLDGSAVWGAGLGTLLGPEETPAVGGCGSLVRPRVGCPNASAACRVLVCLVLWVFVEACSVVGCGCVLSVA